MRIYMTGANGLLGTVLSQQFAEKVGASAWQIHGVSIDQFDIASEESTSMSISAFRPDIVIHLAACAFVDECEKDPTMAERVNALGSRNVANACKQVGAKLIYLSTDYIFDGIARPPDGYTENDLPHPLNMYGKTKLRGEHFVQQLLPDSIIIRTAWLYGGGTEYNNFILKILEMARRAEALCFINDQFGSPTSTEALAQAIVAMILKLQDADIQGIFHIVNSGACTWYDLAIVTLDRLGAHLGEPSAYTPIPIRMSESNYTAPRPAYSVLSNRKYTTLMGTPMPHWKDALDRYLSTLLPAWASQNAFSSS